MAIAQSRRLPDIDGSAPAGKYDAPTDGLLVLRYMFGLTGASLTNGAVGATATRNAAAIKTYLDDNRPKFDSDGNGAVDALTDGLVTLRYLFGLRGPSLIAAAVGPAGIRTTAPLIEAYLQTLLP